MTLESVSELAETPKQKRLRTAERKFERDFFCYSIVVAEFYDCPCPDLRFRLKNSIFAHVAKSEGSGLLRLQMKGIKLTNVEGFMKKSDPFFELSCKRDAAGGLTW